MRFRSFDTLRVFDTVARHMSFTAAANELHLTKGAISYQIKRLESQLGFNVFNRQPGGILLTEKGRKLWHISQASLQQLDNEITLMKEKDDWRIVVGMSTYFASRWLSSRLMHFTNLNPKIGLRLQPTVGLINLEQEGIDIAIRWGRGNWQDLRLEKLFGCPAIATAGKLIVNQITETSFEAVMAEVTLLHDFEGSQSWRDWYQNAGLAYKPNKNDLVIPDPNVRVQAVIDGQGVALNDFLVDNEIKQGRLFQISSTTLSDYGYYLAYPENALDTPALNLFRNWIISEADSIG